MVRPPPFFRSRRGALIAELIVAMAIFVGAVLPMGLMVIREHRLAHVLYNRAVAGEILDGEMEILLAGEWRSLAPGTHPLSVRAEATNALPPGTFEVLLDGRQLRLTWRAEKPLLGGHAAREALLPVP